MWIAIKNYLIKFAVRGLVKAGRAGDAKKLCQDIIKEIEKEEMEK